MNLCFLALDERSTEEEALGLKVHATDVLRVIETSILSFRQFVKMDKKKSGGVRSLFGSQNQMPTPVQLVQSTLEKVKLHSSSVSLNLHEQRELQVSMIWFLKVQKAMRLKELWKKSKSYKKKSWPSTAEDVEMLLGLIDIKVLSRALRMIRISKEQLFWCEEKMKKLSLPDGKLQRDPSPILFPC